MRVIQDGAFSEARFTVLVVAVTDAADAAARIASCGIKSTLFCELSFLMTAARSRVARSALLGKHPHIHLLPL